MTPLLGKEPFFEKPPIGEVVLGVQFDPLPDFNVTHFGRYWAQVRDRFPRIEHQAPLPSIVERLGMPDQPTLDVRFELEDVAPLPRVWFLSEQGGELLQLQNGRFVRNWRRGPSGEPYPRYQTLRPAFEKELGEFIEFARNEVGAELTINQCEVTYVNHIVAGEGWATHADTHMVISLLSDKKPMQAMPGFENSTVDNRYVMSDEVGAPRGRLHVKVSPGYRMPDMTPALTLTLTARGAPLSPGVEGSRKFIDLAHHWVVCGFKRVTTPDMHRVWGMQDDS